MTWWLATRLDWWVAAIFAVLAAAAPIHLTYAAQGRGYGLAFLAGVLLVVGAADYSERHSRAALLVFAAGAVVGIWTLPVFVLMVVAVTVPIMWIKGLRRPVLVTVGAVGGASLVFYAPLLSGIISESGQRVGVRLPWYGFLSGPFRDQLVPNFSLLLPHAPETVLGVLGAAILAVGAFALWRTGRRLLAAILVCAPLITYLGLEAGRFYVQDRFGSYVLLPMLALAAIGFVEIGRGLARVPKAAAPVAIAAVVLSLFAFSKVERLGAVNAEVPLENTQEVAAILNQTGFAEPIVSNSLRAAGFKYYLTRPADFRVLPPSALVTLFCSAKFRFIYVEHGLFSPLADTTCLRRRGATRITIPQRRPTSAFAIWFVPAAPATTGVAAASALSGP